MFMKKFFILIIALFISLTLVSLTRAFVLDTDGMFANSANRYGYDEADETTLSATAGKVVSIALSLVGTIFLAFGVYAGILWLTARGDAEAVKKATGILKTSVIGILIATSAWTITNFVIPPILEKTTGEGGGNGVTGSVEDLVGCCKKCSSTLSPDDPGCTTSVVDNQTACSIQCPATGSAFQCYYSLKKADNCK